MQPDIIQSLNSHIRLIRKRLSMWGLHGRRANSGRHNKGCGENRVSYGPLLWPLYFSITARRKCVYLDLLKLPPKALRKLEKLRTKTDTNDPSGYSRRRNTREKNVFLVEPWQRGDNESRVSIDWNDLYNKILPSCVTIVHGSTRNVWQLLCFQ